MSRLNSGNVEVHEVLVEVVEVTSVLLVEVVGELSLGVPLSSNALIVVHDTESIAVEDATENASDVLSIAARSGLGVDIASGCEGIIGARTLPERNCFGFWHSGKFIMEGAGLKEHVSRLTKISKRDDYCRQSIDCR